MSDQQLTQGSLPNNIHAGDEWEVHMSGNKEPFVLNGKEYSVLEDALVRGLKTLIHFDDFALNTAFFVSSYRTRKGGLKNHEITVSGYLPEPKYDKEMARRKLDEIRKELNVRLSKKHDKEM